MHIEIADDLERAAAEETLGHCTLGLTVSRAVPDDEFDVLLNGTVLPWGTGRAVSTETGPTWPTFARTVGLQYDVGSPPLRQGVNEVEIRRKTDAASGQEPPMLTNVEITITYLDSENPQQ